MIVELCGTDLLELVNGRQVAIRDVIVRTTESDVSSVLGGSAMMSVPDDNPPPPKRGPRLAVEKSGQRWMHAIYPHGRCAAACTNTWQKGDLMLYDYDTRRSLCPQHGAQEFPNLPIPEGLK
jgi:hypothetical protein